MIDLFSDSWGVLPYGDVLLNEVAIHNWIDYHGVVISIQLLQWGRLFSDFWGKTVFRIYC